MIYIRFIGENGFRGYGVVETPEAGDARIVAGDIFRDHLIREERVGIKRVLPPVVPPTIFALGLNYARHIAETGTRQTPDPVLFIKSLNSLCGHLDPIVIPAACGEEVDYEAELAIVIGKRGKNIAPEKAMEHVFGYCCANDVSARNWQINLQSRQWARGKSFDTFCPLGPVIVSRESVPDPHALAISCRLNGRLMQNSSTADMIFRVPEIIASISRGITLEAGTVILTGTPEGVGFTRVPPVYLRDGDLVEVEISGLGILRNPVAAEKSGSGELFDEDIQGG